MEGAGGSRPAEIPRHHRVGGWKGGKAENYVVNGPPPLLPLSPHLHPLDAVRKLLQ